MQSAYSEVQKYCQSIFFGAQKGLYDKILSINFLENLFN